ncbi:uncharacterized protein FOMMEDRAFT_30423 [Fomitiporia mediterranea MF3/22]|uniref:uncharacterized protein n=1 Tax=Fomitiporia mediterranea (strain MF3/22) TaxID=694068 RepID=UPI0004407B80|nr:uncharacterized protein FOMMEDRAFT_30423 [Fomitiporia mediterranea MF3/22]EJD00351.1 hypothetical protein FOMMEDRAFT_30423 [Fomitiporia mediterranea MF3/22]
MPDSGSPSCQEALTSQATTPVHMIQKHPNVFYDVEIERLADEVYRNINPSNGVREILCWDFARTDSFTRDTTFEDILKILKMQLPGTTHDLDVKDAAKEKYSLQWLCYSKGDSKEHKVILKKLNANSQPTGETITGTDEFETNACYRARKQLQDKLHKKFKFYRDRVVD